MKRMTKKFAKVGHAHCLLIDKPVVKLLGVTEFTDLKISTDGQSLLVRPTGPGRPKSPSGQDKNRLTKSLTKIGNSLALYVDRPILELLGIDLDSEVEIFTDGRALLIRPLGADTTRAVAIADEIDLLVENEKFVESRSTMKEDDPGV